MMIVIRQALRMPLPLTLTLSPLAGRGDVPNANSGSLLPACREKVAAAG